LICVTTFHHLYTTHLWMKDHKQINLILQKINLWYTILTINKQTDER